MTSPSGPRVVIVGGASLHWTPRLVCDLLNTPSLAGAQIVLHDIAADRLADMVELAAHLAGLRGGTMTVRGETDRRAALAGADAVVVALSVGGFDSMRHDLEIPHRYGIHQPIGDSVGPGGVNRALRSVPVLLDIARDLEAVAPSAWFVNVSNPLSALTRAVSANTSLRTVGLCNEIVGMQFVLSLLTGAGMHEIDPVVAGVNHFPVITELRVAGQDGFALLRSVLDDPEGLGAEPVWMDPPEGMHWRKARPGRWTKADVAACLPVKLGIFQRFGVLPGAHDSHIVEFMPGFVTEANEHGAGWGIHHYGLDGHVADARGDEVRAAELRTATQVPAFPSGELVATLLHGLVSGEAQVLPVNLPNRGQVTNLPDAVVVETMGIADHDGVRARDRAGAPGIVGEWIRRVSASQELTVQAALSGDRNDVLAALLADPLTGRLPFEAVERMMAELLMATAAWLPQFQ